MWTLIQAAGWPIWPLIICSVISIAIIFERFVALRESVVAPKTLLPEIQATLKQGGISKEACARLEAHSPLGEIFSSALCNANTSREVMKEAIEETGRAVTHKLERYLTTLGTIATVSPLLGLLGTVIGMVELFGAFTATGHDVAMFARGISVALYNTAMGIVVAVPSMIFYRHFRAKVDSLIVEMEQEAIKLVEILHGER
ncbi:biopolymer transport protein ExbB [Novimethylophilus kurashikiensis]|uniref:Biopolymer transport protein ExbB n=1 Tax=Novimethylophilus kurashikiensis TaxID=1825523 RepID=A0A2R5FIB0_9PROT|nr:MotA/TolQ/ExbB proton channel family protein [Novimethylophilus kurashikiensis]GBG15721.1 biopolymer transport protein ExbB [Novimethylophilus kurashikiensis]